MDQFGLFNPIFIAFTVLAALEFWIILKRIGRKYPIREAFTSVAIGLGGRAASALLDVPILLFASWVWEHRLYTADMGKVSIWPILFLASELAYYCEHRFSHRIRWLWAHHKVHHTSTALNFVASIRIGWFRTVAGIWIFFMPLILIGFQPIAVFGMYTANLAFQYLLHTELVPPLGRLEGIVNSPSAHRVHHALNDVYVDKNFGGVLLVFDRLFGTYQKELKAEPCKYGLAHEVASNNPIRILLGGWLQLWQDLRQARGLHEVVMYIAGRPGWQPAAHVNRTPQERRRGDSAAPDGTS